MVDSAFWKNRKVLITGHTGFKGAWLCLWLHLMGSKVTGYALNPPTEPSLFELARVGNLVDSQIFDIRDAAKVKEVVCSVVPEVVFHMAAQPLVRDSYKFPVETYSTNIMGTVNLLEAVRKCNSVRAVVNITTDKCYENREWIWGYRENEPLGGYDPYSSSKACSELVSAAYRSSYFNPKDYNIHGLGLATARAGNVIGGGDWAEDRLIPDCIRAVLHDKTVHIRHPEAIRPWQYVLGPICGYLMLAEKLYSEGSKFAEAWNFGPDETDAKPVKWIVKELFRKLGAEENYQLDISDQFHEAGYLKLDSSKARTKLGWKSIWNIEKAIDCIVKWLLAFKHGDDLQRVCLEQIHEFRNSMTGLL